MPLHGAADTGCLDVIKLLIETGADKNAKGRDGRTPLHYATERGHLDVARLLE